MPWSPARNLLLVGVDEWAFAPVGANRTPSINPKTLPATQLKFDQLMSQQKLSRRTFLQSATAATLAAKLNPVSAQPAAKTEIPYPENGTLIPDDDWRLWIDEKAEWKNDPLFLPEDITVDAEGILHGKGSPLPVNEPPGG